MHSHFWLRRCPRPTARRSAREPGELRGGDGGHGASAELGEPLDAREARFGDAPGAGAAGAVVDLGGEDLGEERQVGVWRSRTAISARRVAWSRTGGQAQFSGGADSGLRGGVADGGCRALLVSSWS
jgi:hypothetical protein